LRAACTTCFASTICTSKKIPPRLIRDGKSFPATVNGHRKFLYAFRKPACLSPLHKKQNLLPNRHFRESPQFSSLVSVLLFRRKTGPWMAAKIIKQENHGAKRSMDPFQSLRCLHSRPRKIAYRALWE